MAWGVSVRGKALDIVVAVVAGATFEAGHAILIIRRMCFAFGCGGEHLMLIFGDLCSDNLVHWDSMLLHVGTDCMYLSCIGF